MKTIDYDKGIKLDVNVSEDGTTTTVFSFKEVEARDYCPNHNGTVNIDGTCYEWYEECDCVS